MEVKIEKLPRATTKINVKVPADRVNVMYQKVLKDAAEHAKIEGFRPGKAPIEIVEKRLDQGKLNGEVINELIKEYYVQVLKEHKIQTVGNPKLTIKAYDKDIDFEFEAEVADKPEIKLGDYRKKLKETYETKVKEHKDEKTKAKLTVDDVIDSIADTANIEFSEILVEEEVTRMLSRLLAQAETLGLSVEQYLSAQNRKAEDLKKEYGDIAEKNIKSEFALAKAIEQEEIKITDEEIDMAIAGIPDEGTRKQLQNPSERWYIVSILAKNKLINKLASEVEPKEEKEDTLEETSEEEAETTKEIAEEHTEQKTNEDSNKEE